MRNITSFLTMLDKGHDSALLRYSLGTAYSGENNHERAIEHLLAAVAFDPGYSAAWKLLGKSYMALKQFENAISSFDSGLAAAKDNGDKQALKEIEVFQKRAQKSLSAQSSQAQETQAQKSAATPATAKQPKTEKAAQ